MKISFNLTVDDWIVFQQFFRGKKSPFSRWIVPIIITCMVWIVLFNAYLAYAKVDDESPMRVWISIAVFFIFAYLLYIRRKSLKRVKEAGLEIEKKHPEAFGSMIMELNEKGIDIQSSQTAKFLTWEEMGTYDKNRKYFFLYSRKGVVYIVPKRALEGQDVDFEAILRTNLSKDQN